MHLIINTDGASRGNPGKASYGFLIKTDTGVILHQEGRYIGTDTNNVAEYTAVLKALEYIHEQYSKKAPHQIQVIADSLLIISQLGGRFKVKSPKLKIIFEKIKILEMDLGVITYKHVFRKDNFLADRLANQALDNLGSILAS